MDLDSYNSYMSQQRAKIAAISERAEAALARLGGVETASHSGSSLSERLCEGLTAEQIERDAKSMRNILRVWKISGKGGPGSRIRLPSGKEFIAPGHDDTPSRFERAVRRTPKHLKKKKGGLQ